MQDVLAIALFRSEFEAEEEAEFPRLSRIPDTHVRRFLHYFRSLSKHDAEPLKCAIAKRAMAFFGLVEDPIAFTDAESQAVEHQNRALLWMVDWQFTSLKTLKMAAGMSRSEHPIMKRQADSFQMPDDLLQRLNGLITCKAADLRKLVKQAFASRFDFSAQKLGGGHWVYHRVGDEDSFAVEIDYGGTLGQQLRYSVYPKKRRPGELPGHLRFESMLGAGFGDWDFITEATADQDIALLADLVEHVVEISQRLALTGRGSTEPDGAGNSHRAG